MSALILVFGWLAQDLSSSSIPQTIEFNRDIRPILAGKCYTCHGPDASARKSALRLDTEDGAKKDLGDGKFAVVAGEPGKSAIINRITAPDPASRMPAGGPALSNREVDLLRRWIEQGAKWEKHWSFIAPRIAGLPTVANKAWPRNGVDSFVLNRLEREGLSPSAEADRSTLIRRLTLDLTGLPPTPAEVRVFLSDNSPNAYEKVVDRLLASPRYGERMATPWLSAARYADTNGYQADGERDMWRWRDWVIDAFNLNMPFDRFTIEQIAGDLLPNATLEQKIATGFNRNHRSNSEGGVLPEEFFTEYVIDRVSTTATVWLGLTAGCARCHDHKFDPLLQKEFYQLYAYFNSIPENGKAKRQGNSPPFIKAPTPEQQAQLAGLTQAVEREERNFAELRPQIDEAQRIWERSLTGSGSLYWSPERMLNAQFPLEGAESLFGGMRFVDGGNAGRFGFMSKFTLAAWIEPEFRDGAIVTRTPDVPERGGYSFQLKDGKLQLNLANRWLDDALRVETAEPIELNRLQHVAATYDGSRLFEGVQIYVDGKPRKLIALLDQLSLDFAGRDPLRIGGGGGLQNRFRGKISGVRLYDTSLTPDEIAVIADSDSISAIAAIPPAQRTTVQSRKIDLYFIEEQAPAPVRQIREKLLEAIRQKEEFEAGLPTVMVMQETEQPLDAHVLIRGSYDRQGEKVERGTPAFLPPLPPGAPNNRLGLARWLVDQENPLTARVTVNRFWEMYFGTGLVKTPDNFGLQGEPPSHPELLDWLATEFMRTGWDVKAMQRLIVTSATYRQSSHVTPELLQRDPENRLLARGARHRLPAEMVRDQALAVAGLLAGKIGGPSVKPYQPEGLWAEAASGNYQQDHGEDLYRRSLYTFWKRGVPPPSMLMFDASSRENAVVSHSRTDTPLQALNLMNDVTYVEAARVFAERMMTEGGQTPASRIAFGFELATSRPPSETESAILMSSLISFLERYNLDPAGARQFVTQGEHPRNEGLDIVELAGYTAVGSLILNLDEVVTRQ